MLDEFIALLDEFEDYVVQCQSDSFEESISASEKRSDAREKLINFVKKIDKSIIEIDLNSFLR